MPAVKWLMHWHPNTGVTLNSQILAEACGCAESLGGAKDGRWKTSIIFYRPMARDGSAPAAGGQQQQQQPHDVPRELLGVALHERPGLYFSILRAQRLVLQADAAFPQVMEKLQSYKARVTLNFEGFQFQLGDFCLRIGKCVPNNSEALRGIMMELNEVKLLETPPCTFDDLKTLAFVTHFCEMPTILSTLCLLRNAPNVELEIEISGVYEQNVEANKEFQNAQWDNGMCANLQVVKMEGVYFLSNEMCFIELDLSKTRLLRTMSISVSRSSSVCNVDALNELLKYRRASLQAQVFFKGKAFK